MSCIIWDWNGTLLDDIDICIHSMNSVLKKYNLQLLKNRDDYKSRFAFPIEKYYKNLGFDFEKVPFHVLASEFIDLYQPASLTCSLIKNAESIIASIDEKVFTQIVLSASKQSNLEQQVSRFVVSRYFDKILGINDIMAKSKIEIGKKWIKENNIDSNQVIIIGDTLHDYEVSKALKCKCIIYTNGHQQIDVKMFDNTFFVQDLMEIKNFI